MKTKDIAKTYGLNRADFDTWLSESTYRYKVSTWSGVTIDEGQNIDAIVNDYKAAYGERKRRNEEARALAAQREAQELAEAEAFENQKRKALSEMLITSGFNFDGYRVARYSGYISGDDVIQIDRGSQRFFGGGVTDVGTSLMQALVQMRRQALAELKEAAFDLGCNAVIGVDFDYLTLDPETVNSNGGTLYLPYVFGVTANGNAVVIERSD